VAVRVEVAGDRQRRAGVSERPGVGVLGAEGERRPREHDRDDAGRLQRLDVGLGGVQQVVGADRPEVGRQFGAAQADELLGVHLRREAVLGAGSQHPPGLLDGEDALLAEDVTENGDALVGDGRQLLADDLVDVLVGRPFVGNGVGAHERRHDIDRVSLVGAAEDLQQPEFGLRVEPVAGFHLDGRRPRREHRIQAPEQQLEQPLVARLPDGPDRPEDAAAGVEYLLVAPPAELGRELVGAVAGEDRVGVAVDEPREDGPSRGVDRAGGVLRGVAGGDGLGRPDGRHLAVDDRHRGVGSTVEHLVGVARGGPVGRRRRSLARRPDHEFRRVVDDGVEVAFGHRLDPQ
jgi:hypothetical protein